MATIAKRTGGTFNKQPLKHIFRALEKMALRHDENMRFRSDNVYDILRSSIEYTDMDHIVKGAEEIMKSKEFKIIKIKDRFSKPTPGGWRDIVLNGYFLQDFKRGISSIILWMFGMEFRQFDCPEILPIHCQSPCWDVLRWN